MLLYLSVRFFVHSFPVSFSLPPSLIPFLALHVELLSLATHDFVTIMSIHFRQPLCTRHDVVLSTADKRVDTRYIQTLDIVASICYWLSSAVDRSGSVRVCWVTRTPCRRRAGRVGHPELEHGDPNKVLKERAQCLTSWMELRR